MASPTLQFKRGLFVNLPSLRAGEPGFTTDKNDFYVGGSDGNKFFGSHRYWSKEDGTNALKLQLVDKDGSNSIGLRAPATLADSNTVYTLPSAPTDGYFLKTNASGQLEWATVTAGASFDNVTTNNSTFTGVSTFSGLIDANAGLNVAGGSTFDDINVTGVGTITTADINGGNIDGTVIGASSAAAGTFTELAYSNSTTSGISTVGSLYVGTDKVLSVEGSDLTLSNIDAIDAVTKATLEATLALDPNDFDTLNVTGISTIGGLLDANGGLDVLGHSELDTVNVSVAATFASATVSDLTAGRVVLAGTGGELEDSANLTFGAGGLIVGSGGINVTGVSTFSADVIVSGDLEVTGNDIKSSSATAITLSGSDVEVKGDLQVTGNDIKASDGATNITMTSSTLTAFAGDIKVGGNDIQASDGVTAITLSAVTGNVGVSSDLTVSGNLNVLGSTTTVNTEILLVKDSLIEVGLVDDNGSLVAPSSDANIDVGMIFHYYDASAKKAAVYWDDSTGRLAFASEVSESSSVITATSYATILAGGLEINNTCTGGTSEVISCVNAELALNNIVVDGGEF